jgi:hypothetical protein
MDERWAKEALLALMLHPLEAVYESALASCLACWTKDPRFGWIAFCLGLALADQGRALDDWKNQETASARNLAEREAKLQRALAGLRSEYDPWIEAPQPPAPEPGVKERRLRYEESSEVGRIFRYDLAARAIKHLPMELVIGTPEASKLLLGLWVASLAVPAIG